MADVTLAAVTAPSPQAFVPRGSMGTLTAEPDDAEAITGGADYGFTQTQANRILALVIEMRRALVAAGLIT